MYEDAETHFYEDICFRLNDGIYQGEIKKLQINNTIREFLLKCGDHRRKQGSFVKYDKDEKGLVSAYINTHWQTYFVSSHAWDIFAYCFVKYDRNKKINDDGKKDKVLMAKYQNRKAA